MAGKSTICVHRGKTGSEYGGINTPIYTSTSYEYYNDGQLYYPRYFNTPNQNAAAEKIAALENGDAALVFSSGMAAITTTILSLLKQGDHVLFQKDLYGGTYHFILTRLNDYGISYSFIENITTENLLAELRDTTRLLYIETPSNPTLMITDLKVVSDFCKQHNLLSIIDNTFASPVNQNPINHGIDIVLHSGTKYLGGHSDICCGVAVSSAEIIEKIRSGAKLFGGSMDANSAYLLERSLKTLQVRVTRQNANAMALAEFLTNHPSVKRVMYPGLPAHPQHEIAKRQMTGFGGMLCFELEATKIHPDDFVKKLKIITPAVSLGGVETILTFPVFTSHAALPEEERRRLGINKYLVRLSVGIEDSADLINDLDSALQ